MAFALGQVLVGDLRQGFDQQNIVKSRRDILDRGLAVESQLLVGRGQSHLGRANRRAEFAPGEQGLGHPEFEAGRVRGSADGAGNERVGRVQGQDALAPVAREFALDPRIDGDLRQRLRALLHIFAIDPVAVFTGFANVVVLRLGQRQRFIQGQDAHGRFAGGQARIGGQNNVAQGQTDQCDPANQAKLRDPAVSLHGRGSSVTARRRRKNRARSSSNAYTTGTTTRVSKVDVIRPPITARAMGARISAP